MRVWTDGAYSNRSKCGGWAWAANLAQYGCGATTPTTNNRMELEAVLQALLYFYQHPEPITIVSDSMYVVGAFNERWILKWESNRWLRNPQNRTAKQLMINVDLWQRILKGVRMHEPGVTFEWVKGHSGDRMNDFVDALAVEQRKVLEG